MHYLQGNSLKITIHLSFVLFDPSQMGNLMTPVRLLTCVHHCTCKWNAKVWNFGKSKTHTKSLLQSHHQKLRVPWPMVVQMIQAGTIPISKRCRYLNTYVIYHWSQNICGMLHVYISQNSFIITHVLFASYRYQLGAHQHLRQLGASVVPRLWRPGGKPRGPVQEGRSSHR